MSKIFCLMGKSASGKDTLYGRLMKDEELGLKPVVSYTTRPQRSGEEEGREYHFTDETSFNRMKEDGIVIENRVYHTCHGDWIYFTADDGSICLDDSDYLVIGTPDSFEKIREYYGDDNVIPLYISLDDGVRLERALSRERSQDSPKYQEMCRRFLADAEDFSEERLEKLGIEKRFDNSELEVCLKALRETIWTLR